MKIRPLHDRILLKRIEEKESIKGGIIIPDTAKEKPQEGVVVAVGNGKILDNGTKVTLEVKEGDHVVTSGLVGGFPRGIAIGTITGIDREEGALFQTAELAPEVDVNHVEEVLIIQAPHGQSVDATPKSGGGGKPER